MADITPLRTARPRPPFVETLRSHEDRNTPRADVHRASGLRTEAFRYLSRRWACRTRRVEAFKYTDLQLGVSRDAAAPRTDDAPSVPGHRPRPVGSKRRRALPGSTAVRLVLRERPPDRHGDQSDLGRHPGRHATVTLAGNEALDRRRTTASGETDARSEAASPSDGNADPTSSTPPSWPDGAILISVPDRTVLAKVETPLHLRFMWHASTEAYKRPPPACS